MATPKKKYPPSVLYEDGLCKRLRNPKYARAYLTEYMEEDVADFLRAIQRVAKANGLTVETMAERTGIHRVTLQRIYSGKTEPKFKTVALLLKGLNIDIALTPAKKEKAA